MAYKDQVNQGEFPKPSFGLNRGEDEIIDKEMMWLPPTYRNIEHEDLLLQFYEGPILHKYSFIFYSCVLISSGNEIAPITTLEVCSR